VAMFLFYLASQLRILIYNGAYRRTVGQNDRFLPCQLGDSIQQPFGPTL
jgi:hypothetical protein